ncbi:MAG: lectin like domain-containing protein [Synergistaceae bacterium]|jgi:C1A family cysteine protease|nr:lectin like domain-containing protein [Synergistaceae bacterium]
MFRQKIRAVSLLLVGIFLLSGALLREARGADSAESAPVNPKFLEWQENVRQAEIQKGISSGFSRGGVIPDPVDRSHLGKARYRSLRAAAPNLPFSSNLPASYDARVHGCVTPVRNQNPFGTCWAFGAFASLESTQKKLGNTHDFAERHLAWFVYTDYKEFPSFTPESSSDIYNNGGNAPKAAAMLTRGTGPVDETTNPYSNTSYMAPADESAPKILDVTDVWYLSIADVSGSALGSDREATYEAMKRLIITEGVVNVTYYDYDGSTSPSGESDYYNTTHAAYYYDARENTNHSVAIVGWDDNYPKNNFNRTPPSDGAWLVKNSWGENHGINGYFWISYYDRTLDFVALFKGKPVNSYKTTYLYDPLGETASEGSRNDNSMWGANVFKATEDGQIEAVAFNTSNTQTDYEVRIYKNPTSHPSSGALQGDATTTGSHLHAGYHTVTLRNPVRVNNGEKFAIAIKITRNTAPIYFAAEEAWAYYAENATASLGQSFLAFTQGGEVGPETVWDDLYNTNDTANFCIRALSNPVSSGGGGGGGGCDSGFFGVISALLVLFSLLAARKKQQKIGGESPLICKGR